MIRLKSAGLALAAGLAAFAVASCATPTPYGQAQANGYGFREQQIETNRFSVSFAGNSATTPDAVGDAALRRAADLTLQHGYEWFEIVSRTDNQEGAYRGGSGMSVGVGGSSGSYGSSTGVGVGLSFPIGGGGGGATTTTLEILMGRGERPDRPSAYDAMAVSNNLARAAAAQVDQGY
jgi:hypothetical protein